MSHITEIAVEISDLNALDQACKDLGVKLMKNQKTFRHFASQSGKCEHAISLPNNNKAYEIGVVKNGTKFGLKWDEWAGGYGMVEKVGTGAMKLVDHYGAEVAKKQLSRQGYRISQSIGAQGQVILKVR